MWLDLNLNLLAGSKKRPTSITSDQFLFSYDPIDGRRYVHLNNHPKHRFLPDELNVRTTFKLYFRIKNKLICD